MLNQPRKPIKKCCSERGGIFFVLKVLIRLEVSIENIIFAVGDDRIQLKPTGWASETLNVKVMLNT